MNRTLIPMMALAALAAVAPCRAATLKIDDAKSRIQVAIKATGHAFTGNLEKFTAKVSGASGSLAPSAVSIEWNFADLKTADAERDHDMLDWLSHKTMPKGSFRMDKAWTDDAGRKWLKGKLKIHGVSKEIAFPYNSKLEGKRLTLDGEVWIDHEDFKLGMIRKMGVMKVNPKLRIYFHLEGDVK